MQQAVHWWLSTYERLVKSQKFFSSYLTQEDLSRLGRNTIDAGYYIEKYFPLHGIRFISVNDQFDSTSPDNDGNHVILPLKNMINEAYAFDISRKVKAQQRQSMKSGEFVGARPPYGYEKAADISRQALDVLIVLIRKISLQGRDFTIREKNIFKLSITAACSLCFFCLAFIFIFLFSITCGQFLPYAG